MINKEYKKNKKKFRNKLEYSYYNRFLTYIKWAITKYPYKSSDKLATDLFYKFKDTIILKKLWFIEKYEYIIKNRKQYENLLSSILEEYIKIAKKVMKDYTENIENNSKNSNGEKKYYYNKYKFRKNDINKIKETITLFNDFSFQDNITIFCNNSIKIQYYIDVYKGRLKKDNYIISSLYKKGFNIDNIKQWLSEYNNINGINKYKEIVENKFNEYDKNKIIEKITKFFIAGWYNKVYEKLISNKEEKEVIDDMLNTIMTENYNYIYTAIKEKIVKYMTSKKLDINDFNDKYKLKKKFSYYNYEMVDDIIHEIIWL